MAPKKSSVNKEPLILSLGGSGVTIASDDISYVSDFAGSLTGGQVKSKLTKFINRKTLSHDDKVQVLGVISSEFPEFVRTFPKYDALPNKKTVVKRARAIAAMAQNVLKEESDDDEPEEDEPKIVDITEDATEPAAKDDEEEEEEEEEEAENDEEAEETEKESEDEETDEEMEARAGSSGFIPVTKPLTTANSGKISIKSTLLTATYRTKEGREHNPTAVVGVGPGKLRFEAELNEDGSLKRKTSTKAQNASDSQMYFYTGSLADENSSEVPLKAGIRLTDSSHLQRLCAEIVVRAFSQEIFTHKGIKDKGKRGTAKAAILKWLTKEVEEGVGHVLEQIYSEARAVLHSEKEETQEAKRKFEGQTKILENVAKKKKST